MRPRKPIPMNRDGINLKFIFRIREERERRWKKLMRRGEFPKIELSARFIPCRLSYRRSQISKLRKKSF